MEEKTTKLKLGTIQHLQEYVAEKIKERGFEDEGLHERLLMLTEEVGELINACRKISGMYVDQNREIVNKTGEELCDVINMVFAVGIKLGIDIEKEFLTKEAIIDKRKYERASKKEKQEI
jgi:NTP pyrophosphatase (non-canonical NTP hydrolase)